MLGGFLLGLPCRTRLRMMLQSGLASAGLTCSVYVVLSVVFVVFQQFVQPYLLFVVLITLLLIATRTMIRFHLFTRHFGPPPPDSLAYEDVMDDFFPEKPLPGKEQ